MTPIRSLLIANRGEIAVRIIRAAQEMGIRTVAIYSDADADTRWVRLADEARRIGPALVRQSYLDITAIVRAGMECGVDAVHPGYGLLSENAAFATSVIDAGMCFVGPTPAVLARMGDKVTARRAAIEAGLPVLSGSDDAVASLTDALAQAEQVGWPVAVKACLGGGGRGLRVAPDAAALNEALSQARGEAATAFGRDDVFIERYLDRPRHVEVQVLCDNHGHVLHLSDRDCTVQRRHQKLIEEAPAPNLSNALRAAMHAAAVQLCRHVGYVNAGTVEFLVDRTNDSFFFLEMNTRLQVEHGVTELVTGVDLVKAQLAIAGGAALPFEQHEITVRGHAIEARITAEDVSKRFQPTAGKIERLRLPAGPGVRCDFGVDEGDEVSAHYDSMFGKVLTWGSDREEARRRLMLALGELDVASVPTTTSYLSRVLDEAAFVEVKHDTGSAERDWSAHPLERLPRRQTSATIRWVYVPWGNGSSSIAVHRGADAVSTASRQRERTRRVEQGVTDHQVGTQLIAPMDAVVARIGVVAGQRVSAGEELLVLEAMKMQLPVTAPSPGRIKSAHVTIGEAVRSGALLLSLEQDG